MDVLSSSFSSRVYFGTRARHSQGRGEEKLQNTARVRRIQEAKLETSGERKDAKVSLAVDSLRCRKGRKSAEIIGFGNQFDPLEGSFFKQTISNTHTTQSVKKREPQTQISGNSSEIEPDVIQHISSSFSSPNKAVLASPNRKPLTTGNKHDESPVMESVNTNVQKKNKRSEPNLNRNSLGKLKEDEMIEAQIKALLAKTEQEHKKLHAQLLQRYKAYGYNKLSPQNSLFNLALIREGHLDRVVYPGAIHTLPIAFHWMRILRGQQGDPNQLEKLAYRNQSNSPRLN